jgi:alanine dehydrogenase
MVVLDEAAVRRVLRIDALIPVMEQALRSLSFADAVQPLRSVLQVAEHGGYFFSMPASVSGQVGAKLVTLYPGNRELPTHHALIVLFRPETGEPFVVMDGRLITEMRTAAVSAVATQRLARAKASTLAILGAGVQAHSHLEAMRLVRRFDDVRVWSPRHGAAFAQAHGVRAAASAEEAVRGADVVVVATSAHTPVLRGEWLSPGAHINAIGAARPEWRELDDEVLRRSRLYVESRDAASRESGDVIAGGTIVAEIGEVIAGTMPGREHDDEITLFKSVGVAVADVASAGLVCRELGLS